MEANLQSAKEQQSETVNTEYERLTNELQETKQAKDDLQSLLEKSQQQEQTGEEEINRLQELIAEQTKESSLQIQLEHFKSQLENSHSLCEQLQVELEEKQKKIHQLQKKDVDFSDIQDEQNERYSQLELQFKQILSEKSDQLHSQRQTNDQILQLEQTIKEFEVFVKLKIFILIIDFF